MPEISVEVRQVGQTTTSEGVARQHKVLVDRPEAKGGLDKGAMGGELLLLAFGGCFMSNLIAAAAARNITVQNLKTVVRGELGSAPPRFDSIILEVHGRCADEDLMRKIIEISERGCIVHNTLKPSVKLEVKRVM
ncbi:OsmC family protein [Candidatus Acetothermia bacterium]|nr:OsmC family protein [Candidatus Acetothermia bacterium]MBI3661422.1 OsmC family protein [Candidatus Acetothermia bacterium]